MPSSSTKRTPLRTTCRDFNSLVYFPENNSLPFEADWILNSEKERGREKATGRRFPRSGKRGGQLSAAELSIPIPPEDLRQFLRSDVGDAEIEAGYRSQRIVGIRARSSTTRGIKYNNTESWIMFGGRRGPSTTLTAYLLG